MSEVTNRIVSRADELGLSQADIMRATNAGKSTVHKWFNQPKL